MKKIMRFTSCLFVVAVLLVVASSNTHATERKHWGQNTIDKWVKEGYLPIPDLEAIDYDESLTRGQFITLMNNMFKLEEEVNIDYEDVNDKSVYYKHVRIASKYGYINGYINGQGKQEFKPNQFITRQEVATIITRVMDLELENIKYDKLIYYDVFDIHNYAVNSVYSLHEQGYITGYEDGTFKPNKIVTYIEAITMLDNIVTKFVQEGDHITGHIDGHVVLTGANIVISNATIAGHLYYPAEEKQRNTILNSVKLDGDLKIGLHKGLNTVKAENKLHNGIPIVVINTENNEPVIEKDKKLNGTMKIIDGSKVSYKTGLYDGTITIKGRGNSTWGMPKKPYAVVTSSSVEILDMPKEKDWVLLANYADKSLMRNYLALYLGGELSLAHSPKMRLVDLFLNGDYQGSYMLGEKVEISKSRLNIHELSINDVTEEEINGGYLIEKDWLDRIDEDDFYVETKRINNDTYGILNIKDPSGPKLTEGQKNYITTYLQEAEDALYSDTFTNSDVGYEQYFDMQSLIDWYIVNEVFMNIDAQFRSSVFMHKDTNEKIKFGPIWDFDIGAGNINYFNLERNDYFYIKDSIWISRFFEDPKFVEQLKKRWNEVAGKELVNMMKLLDETELIMKNSAADNFDKWNILGIYVWPNPDGFENRTTYESEVEFLRQWLNSRIAWLDEAINQL